MRRLQILIVSLASALALAGAAQAGCFATAGVSPLPKNVGAGETWSVDVTILQHGVTPMPDATPAVVVTNDATGMRREFQAAPTASTGHYRVDVVFPGEGSWAIAVNDGFPVRECAQTHTFGSFAIGAPGSGGAQPQAPQVAPATAPALVPGRQSTAFPWWALGLGLGVAAAAAAWLLARSGRRSTRPA